MFAWRSNFENGGSVDPYWANVSFLENFEQSPSGFIDSSANNYVVQAVNNVQPTTNSPFSGYQGSMYFDGTLDMVRVPNASWNNITTGTIECWVYLSSIAEASIIAKQQDGVTTQGLLTIGKYANTGGLLTTGTPGVIYWHSNNGTGLTANSSSAISANTWTHIAVTFNSSGCTFWINGTSSGTGTGNFVVPNNTNPTPQIGTWYADGAQKIATTGYISNLRIVSGSLVYTSNFTPSTTPLTAISGTTLLLNTSNQGMQQNNYFVDTSSTKNPITISGTLYGASTSPYGPRYPGSSYSGATTNSLSVPDSASWVMSGDFTIEAWINQTTIGGTIAAQWTSTAGSNQAWNFNVTAGGYLSFSWNTGAGSPSTVTGTTQTITSGAWNHVAVTRSGSTIRLFVNGTADSTTGSQSGSLNNSTIAPTVFSVTGSSGVIGYLSDVRIVNGTAVYTSSFAVPTTPLTAITNTVLLMPLTQGFYDVSPGKNLIINSKPTLTSTNYALLSAVKKFGTQSSVYINNGLQTVLDSSNLQLGSGDITVEGWVYRNASGATHSLLCKGSSTTGWLLQINSSNKLVLTVTTTALLTSTTSINASSWTHFCWTRSGTTNYLFVNGNLETSASDSTNFTQTNNMLIGVDRSSVNGLNGYLDDIRITKGIARYVASFTTPTKPFATTGKP